MKNPQEIDGVSIYGVTFGCMDMSDGVIGFEFIKPYLFPLSSMTLDQQIEYSRTLVIFDESHCSQTHETYDWLDKNHFDYRDLIPLRLAIDATNLNIY